MPKLDGLGVMEKVKRDADYKKTPSFIVITAIGQEGNRECFWTRGKLLYNETFDNDVVLSRIKQLKGNGHNKFIDNHRVSTYENKQAYMKRNLETDVTNIIHEIGYQPISRDINT